VGTPALTYIKALQTASPEVAVLRGKYGDLPNGSADFAGLTVNQNQKSSNQNAATTI
jgi:hypothetical protein